MLICAAEDLDEMNIEIMRNTLYKAYLDDFAKYCTKMGGSTADVMGDLLSFEVRILAICDNSRLVQCQPYWTLNLPWLLPRSSS